MNFHEFLKKNQVDTSTSEPEEIQVPEDDDLENEEIEIPSEDDES